MMQNMNPKPNPSAKGNGKGIMMAVIIVLIVAVVVLLAVMVFSSLKDKTADKKVEQGIDENAYYAVFLSNGQVYFGHLNNITDEFPELDDIYYLQLNQQEQQAQVQPAEGEQAELQDQAQEQEPELSLVKLGKELHGPEDKMVLNKAHILFYEKLKDDSNVVEAIKEDKEKEE